LERIIAEQDHGVKHAEAGSKAAIEKAVAAEAEAMRLKTLLERERRGRGTVDIAALEQEIWDANVRNKYLQGALGEVEARYHDLQVKYGETERQESVVWQTRPPLTTP